MIDLRILLVDNYDSYTWNLFQLIWKVAGVPPVVVRNDEATADELLRQDFTHVVISPGPGTAARDEDFGLCRALLEQATVPVLGVCLGHQGLALAFGGDVRHAPEIVHGQTSAIAALLLEALDGLCAADGVRTGFDGVCLPADGVPRRSRGPRAFYERSGFRVIGPRVIKDLS
ncbi:glutamine amidotransferase-related protein [Streptomyces avidinii]